MSEAEGPYERYISNRARDVSLRGSQTAEEPERETLTMVTMEGEMNTDKTGS